MWRWLKQWRDWVMNDVMSRTRLTGPQALHFSYERGGHTLDGQPIPWNADAVLVEANVRLPASGRSRDDFSLHIPNREPVRPDSLRPTDTASFFHVFFRLPPLTAPLPVELFWRDRSLGSMELPFLSRAEFVKHLTLEMPTLTVNLGQHNIACNSFVSTQCKGVIANAVVRSPTPLLPLLDERLEVEFASQRSKQTYRFPVHLAGSQLESKHALVTLLPNKLPVRIGTWTVTWLLNDKPLTRGSFHALDKRKFEKSLRISETRYLVQDHDGRVKLHRQPPEDRDFARLGPCFFLSSSENGMAGLCTLQTHVLIPDAVQPPLLLEQEVLITDGPTPFVPGTLEVDDLSQVTGFELNLGNRNLGRLPMTPAPAAKFNSEGGFQPAMDFTWSSAAEEQLTERLERLLEGK